jgi:hypothetical protein
VVEESVRLHVFGHAQGPPMARISDHLVKGASS